MLTQRRVYVLLAVLFAIVTICSFYLFVTFIIQSENSPTWSVVDLYPVIGLGITTASLLATVVFVRAAQPRKDT